MESLKKLLNENVTFLCNENFDELDLPEKISLDFQETEKFEETKETNLSICIKLSISWFFTRATKTKAFTITPCKLKVKHFQIRQNVGSSGQELFCENGVLKDFAIFTGNTVAGCYVIKKRLQHSSFHVSIAKFLRTSILKNICRQLLVKTCQKRILCIQILIQRMFSCLYCWLHWYECAF